MKNPYVEKPLQIPQSTRAPLKSHLHGNGQREIPWNEVGKHCAVTSEISGEQQTPEREKRRLRLGKFRQGATTVSREAMESIAGLSAAATMTTRRG